MVASASGSSGSYFIGVSAVAMVASSSLAMALLPLLWLRTLGSEEFGSKKAEKVLDES